MYEREKSKENQHVCESPAICVPAFAQAGRKGPGSNVMSERWICHQIWYERLLGENMRTFLMIKLPLQSPAIDKSKKTGFIRVDLSDFFPSFADFFNLSSLFYPCKKPLKTLWANSQGEKVGETKSSLPVLINMVCLYCGSSSVCILG